jgi:hypothetical protein
MKGLWGMAQVVEHFPSTCNDLSSTPSTEKKSTKIAHQSLLVSRQYFFCSSSNLGQFKSIKRFTVALLLLSTLSSPKYLGYNPLEPCPKLGSILSSSMEV